MLQMIPFWCLKCALNTLFMQDMWFYVALLILRLRHFKASSEILESLYKLFCNKHFIKYLTTLVNSWLPGLVLESTHQLTGRLLLSTCTLVLNITWFLLTCMGNGKRKLLVWHMLDDFLCTFWSIYDAYPLNPQRCMQLSA